jgi:hypothetical protein
VAKRKKRDFVLEYVKLAAYYDKVIDLQHAKTKYLVGDLLEIDSDLTIVAAEITRLIECKFDDQEDIFKCFDQLRGRLWHTIDHMRSLETALRVVWNQQLKEAVKAEKKRVKGRLKAPSKKA